MTDAKHQAWTQQIKGIKDLLSAEECNTYLYTKPVYYTAYLNNCKEELAITAWFREHSWREVVQKLTSKFPPDTNIRLLSIGCGPGR